MIRPIFSGSIRILGLAKSLGQEFLADTGDLDIHLQGGNTKLGTSHLEVHVAIVILAAEDITEDCRLVSIFDKAHGNSGNWLADLHACVHETEDAATN